MNKKKKEKEYHWNFHRKKKKLADLKAEIESLRKKIALQEEQVLDKENEIKNIKE